MVTITQTQSWVCLHDFPFFFLIKKLLKIYKKNASHIQTNCVSNRKKVPCLLLTPNWVLSNSCRKFYVILKRMNETLENYVWESPGKLPKSLSWFSVRESEFGGVGVKPPNHVHRWASGIDRLSFVSIPATQSGAGVAQRRDAVLQSAPVVSGGYVFVSQCCNLRGF